MLVSSNNKGDTIVEVILALGVLSLVIVSGYAIATSSLRGVQVSKERGEALKIAESQIENLKYRFSEAPDINALLSRDEVGVDPKEKMLDYSVNMPLGLNMDNPGFTADMGFCFLNNGSGDLIRFIEPSALNASGEYPTECIYDGRYLVYITTVWDAANLLSGHDSYNHIPLLYQINVTWDKLGGGEFETLQLQDKVFMLWRQP